jgi:hypothetical protein
MNEAQHKEVMEKLTSLDWHVQDVTHAIRDAAAQQQRLLKELIEEVKKK